VNNKSNIEIGFDNNSAYGKAPKNCVIANNIIIANENPIIKYYSTTSLIGASFQNNIMYSSGTSSLGLTGISDAQIKIVDPQLVQSNCRAFGQDCNNKLPVNLFKLTATSPAINASIGYEYATHDFEGQPVVGIRDIGADEFNSISEITNGPLSEEQVGPTAPENYVYEMNTSTAIPVLIENNLTAYPNPFSGKTIIVVPENAKENLIYTLYNSMGQIIEQSYLTTQKGETQFEINTSSKGILFCEIKTINKKYLIKLISK
jgi:hypothetical protein